MVQAEGLEEKTGVMYIILATVTYCLKAPRKLALKAGLPPPISDPTCLSQRSLDWG